MNIEEMLSQIKTSFPEERVCEMLDEEISNWTEDGWEDDFDNEFESYGETGNREAEEAVINYIIDEWRDEYNRGKELDLGLYVDLYERIEKEYRYTT